MSFFKEVTGFLIALAMARVFLLSYHATPLSAGEISTNIAFQGQRRLAQGQYTRRLTVEGLERSYLLYIPSGLNAGTQAPVIIALHGGGGTPEILSRQTELHERAGRAGFIVVYPAGYGRSWNAGDCCGPAQRLGIDDVAFVKALADDLASVANVDRRRLFVTGFSNGGKMTYRLACELSDWIAAIAPLAAAISLPDSNCNPTRPVPVLHFHGLADEYAPFNGGASKYGPAGIQRSVPETIGLWLRLNGCTNETRVTYQRGAATCTTHPNCQGQAEVALCTITGMGHQWPGGKPIFSRRYGPGTTDISASDVLPAFFHNHSIPSGP
jgi:polyhydroxybutyrate depolymerase